MPANVVPRYDMQRLPRCYERSPITIYAPRSDLQPAAGRAEPPRVSDRRRPEARPADQVATDRDRRLRAARVPYGAGRLAPLRRAEPVADGGDRDLHGGRRRA